MKNKTFLLVGISCLVLIFSLLSVSKIQAWECEDDGCSCISDQQYDEAGESCSINEYRNDSKDCEEDWVCCCPITCTGDCICNRDSDPCSSGMYVDTNKTCEREDFKCCCPLNGNSNGSENGNENGNGNLIRIENPLTATSFEMIIDNSIDFIFQIALVLAPLMVVIAGFLFVTAGGNSEQINKAKTMIIWTVLGFLIILLSKGIMGIIMNLLGVG